MRKDILARIFVYSLSSLLLLFIPHKVFASTLFQDDFINSSQWTVNSGAWQIVDGKYGASVSGPQGSRSTANIDITTQNYIVEFDMYSVQGVDRTVRFRTGSNIGEYDLHFTNDGIATNFGVDNHSFILENHPLSDNHFYHFKIELNGQHFIVNIDGNKIFDITDSNYSFDGSEQLSLVVATGGVTTEVYFDNVKVTTLDDDSKLSVPSLKQTDPQWADETYDSANLWSPGQTGMGDWGCAVTSAAMVFQYNGVNKMPDNTDLTPGNLNGWLKAAPDGYVRNGLVNWLALTRLARLAKANNGYSFDALEYNRINSQDDTALRNYIDNKIPGILDVSGHFVVATGSDSANTTFFINDPYFDRTTLADTYNKSYYALGTFTPANSDLSYIMMVINPNVTIALTDDQGNMKGESFIQNPIAGQIDGATNSRGSVKIFYFKKPSSGKYTLKLKSNTQTNYQLDRYLYDKDGNYSGGSVNGNLVNGTTDTYILNFDKDNTNNSTVSEITFDYLRQEIIDLYNQKKFKNLGTYKALLEELNLAKTSRIKVVTKVLLDTMIITIKKDRKLDSASASLLINDIQSLKNSL